jgi:glucose/arabinose dehydrogenase
MKYFSKPTVTLAALWLTGAAFLFTSCAQTAQAPSPVGSSGDAKTAWGEPIRLPEPYHTPSAGNGPRVIARPDGARVQVPAGFVAEVVAEGFERPRAFLLGPSNEVLMTDASNDGAVYAFAIEANGKLSAPRKILGDLRTPYGLEYRDDYLYVAETTSVKRYRYDSKAMTVTLPGEEIIDLKSVAGGHWTRNLLFNQDKSKLYLAAGSRSNVDAGEIRLRASITRYNPDGSGQEYVAEGTRNPIGLEWNPNTGDLWAAVQERDALGDDLVPDYLTRIQTGGFYGWPYAYIGPNEDPRRKGERPDLVAKTIVPDVPLQPHGAVLGFTFYTGKSFPAEYQNGVFLCYHGSWNRSQRVGYSLAFVPFGKDGKPTGPPRDFLTGFLLDPDSKEVWGRPVDVMQLPDGSLLMSDDGGKIVWQIRYTGTER